MSPFPGLLPPSQHGLSLPTTNLTLHWDYSDISTLWKTFTSGNDPCWTDVCTADADVIAVCNTIVPAEPAALSIHSGTQATERPILRITAPLLGSQSSDWDGTNDEEVINNRVGTVQTLMNGGPPYISVGGSTFITSVRFDAFPASGGFSTILWVPVSSKPLGIFTENAAGDTRFSFQVSDATSTKEINIDGDVNTNYVLMMRWDGTTMFASVNGGTESSLTCGPQTSVASHLAVMGNASIGSSFSNGRMGETAIYNVDLAGQGSDLTLALNYFLAKWT